MNYTIIGNDGKSYGPIGAEQICQWIKQSRVESRTPVFVEGSTDWTFLGLRPEFAAEFSDNPPTMAPLKADACAGTHPLATWGFICGLLGWTCCGCCAPFDILGLTFSIIALVQINARAKSSDGHGRGLAIAGIVLSATNLVWSLGMTLVGMLSNAAQGQFNFGN